MKKTVWLLCLVCCSCVKKPGAPALKVAVVNARTLLLYHVDNNLLANFQQDTLGNRQWQTLLPVYRMPADTDMKDY